jgi:hypothetical protein
MPLQRLATAILLALFFALSSCTGCTDALDDEWLFVEPSEDAAEEQTDCPDEPDIGSTPDAVSPTCRADNVEWEWETYWTAPETCEYVHRLCYNYSEVAPDSLGARDGDCGCGCRLHACEAQDIRGVGDCPDALGYAYNGWTCAEVRGCDCVGQGCDNLHQTWVQCVWNFLVCVDVICDPMHVMGVGDCDHFWGFRYAGGEEICEPITGCSCEGWQCDFLYPTFEECLNSHPLCSTNAWFGCPPWHTAPVGTCDDSLGYTFDGETCVPLKGCSCMGEQCHLLEESSENCLKRTRDCTGHCGSPMGSISSDLESLDPTLCPDGSAYTVIDFRPQCVDPETCEEVE